MLEGLGISHQFVPGVTKFRKKRNVAAAHANAFDAMGKAPFIVFEDDQELLWDDCILPDMPPDADIIYLANSQQGCLPDRDNNKEKFGLRAYYGLALAEVYNDEYLRLSSMISAMAILVLTEKGRLRYRDELRKAFNRDTAIDIRYAFAMPDIAVYALHAPMFAEAAEMQIDAKRTVGRFSETHAALPHATEGDIRIAYHRHHKLIVKAVRDAGTGVLSWKVNNSCAPGDLLPPITLRRKRLPSYNRDILMDRSEIIRNAKVFPPDLRTSSCGVTDEIGRFCELSAEYRQIKKCLPAPEFTRHDAAFQKLGGTYLYGGWMHPHFGHFLVESTSRLWGLDYYGKEIDGIIFVPYGPKSIWRTRKAYGPIFKVLAGDVPIIAQATPAIVERLIVCEPGFGHQARMRGSESYVKFVRERIAKMVAPEGPDRIYISRSQLSHKRGGIFGEDRLEEHLASEGYEIFHPQKHSAETQLARYRAASHIVSLDGSSLHFAAFAVRSDAKVAIIKRRASDIQENMARHIERFSGAEAVVIDAIKEMWVNEDRNRIDYASYGRLDLTKVTQVLFRNGFSRKSDALKSLSLDEIKLELERRPIEASGMVPLRSR